MAYVYPNYPSKAALSRAIKAGLDTITACENTPAGQEPIQEGSCVLEGPHWPEPHRWYGQAVVKEGRVVSVK